MGRSYLSFLARQKGITAGAIAFRMAGELDNLEPRMDLAVVPEIQFWQGVQSVRLRIKGMRPAGRPPQDL